MTIFGSSNNSTILSCKKESVPKIVVIGCGSMGAKHIQVISASTDSILDAIIDSDIITANRVSSKYNVRFYQSIDDYLEETRPDIAILSTSTKYHYDISLRLSAMRINTLVEKPLSTNLFNCQEILESYKTSNTYLRCGFLEDFDPIFSKIRDMKLPICSMHFIRNSNARERNSVLWDLLIHDIHHANNFFPQFINDLKNSILQGNIDREIQSGRIKIKLPSHIQLSFQFNRASLNPTRSIYIKLKDSTDLLYDSNKGSIKFSKKIEYELLEQLLTKGTTIENNCKETFSVKVNKFNKLNLQLRNLIDTWKTGKGFDIFEAERMLATHLIVEKIERFFNIKE